MSARLMGWAVGSGRIDAPIAALLRVGATTDNDVVVRVDGVSRSHARILGESDGYWIEDANSRNGTWVNGERVKRARLRHLDVITFGRFAELVFVERDSTESPAPRARADLGVRIEWLDGDSRGTFVDIARGETLMGRAESCALVINSPAISRAHARISHTGDRVVIEDLGSANGTCVNGQPLSGPLTLASGAEVTVGDQRRFRVLIDGTTSPLATETAGAVPAGAQDMDWVTRLVYSAEDLEAVARAAGAIDKSSPPVMVPVGKNLSPPIVPVPSPAVPAQLPQTPAAAAPAPAPPQVRLPAGEPPPPPPPQAPPAAVGSPASPDATRLGGADLRLPPTLDPPPPEAETQYGSPGIGAPPPFAARVPSDRDDGTQLDGAAAKSLRSLSAAPTRPPALSEPGAGNNLPAATVLGMPDVGPPPTALGSPGGERVWTAEPPPPFGQKMLPAVASVRLSGDVGVFALTRGTSTVGRSMEATVRIDSREVSRIHAIVTVTEREVLVEDRGSVNGTSINGKAISGAAPLTDGDRLSFADFEFRVEINWTEGN